MAQSSGPIMYEFEIESFFLYQTGLCGALLQSYLPIVGSGVTAAFLHYNANQKQVFSNNMVLIDAGCEYWGYPFLLFIFIFLYFF